MWCLNLTMLPHTLVHAPSYRYKQLSHVYYKTRAQYHIKKPVGMNIPVDPLRVGMRTAGARAGRGLQIPYSRDWYHMQLMQHNARAQASTFDFFEKYKRYCTRLSRLINILAKEGSRTSERPDSEPSHITVRWCGPPHILVHAVAMSRRSRPPTTRCCPAATSPRARRGGAASCSSASAWRRDGARGRSAGSAARPAAAR